MDIVEDFENTVSLTHEMGVRHVKHACNRFFRWNQTSGLDRSLDVGAQCKKVSKLKTNRGC